MIRSKKLTKIENLKHGFFNSIGGHSKNIYKSLNCGPGSLDNKSNIKKNLQIVKKKISNKKTRSDMEDIPPSIFILFPAFTFCFRSKKF